MKKGNNGKTISTICLVVIVFVCILVQFFGSTDDENSLSDYKLNETDNSYDVEEQAGIAGEDVETLIDDVDEPSTSFTDSDTQYAQVSSEEYESVYYYFRNDKLLQEHYEKHGVEMGFESLDAYVDAANDVIQNPDSLHKIEAEDGDDIYYLEASNEFVVVSTDEYIRTYFCPDKGIDYYNRQ